MSKPTSSLLPYIAHYRRRVVLSMALIAITVLLQLLLPFILRFAIDGFADRSMTMTTLAAWTFLFMAGNAVAALLSLWMRRIPLETSHDIAYDIRSDLFAHLTRLDQSFYQGHRIGDLMTRAASDLGKVREFIGQGILQGSRTVFVFTIAFGIMFTISPPLTWIMVLLLPTMSILCYAMLRLIRPRHESVQEHLAAMTQLVQQGLVGIRAIKGFAAESRYRDRYESDNRDLMRSNLQLSLVERATWPLMFLLFGVGQVLLLIFGGRLVIRDALTIGELVQFLQYMAYLQWPMLALGWTVNLMVRGLASWKRIAELLDTKPTVYDGERTDPTLDQVRGDIEFRQVSLALDDRRILENIQLTIQEGATIGITGPTGSGKTMLASLLARQMDPTEGHIFIGRHDLREYPLAVLRQGLGVAPQEPFLFSDTLSANIQFGLDSPDPHTMEWASDVAQLHSDIDTFPDRFETMVGERGVTLSGGQRQRTAISRAIARNPDILILDDVLSAVDTQTEARILARLNDVLRERTSILISHRVSTLARADQIVVMEGGRITQLGSHQDLVSQPGYYHDLDEVQRLEQALETYS